MFSLYAATFLNSLILNSSRQWFVSCLPFLMKSFMVLLFFFHFFSNPNSIYNYWTTINYNFCCLDLLFRLILFLAMP